MSTTLPLALKSLWTRTRIFAGGMLGRPGGGHAVRSKVDCESAMSSGWSAAMMRGGGYAFPDALVVSVVPNLSSILAGRP